MSLKSLLVFLFITGLGSSLSSLASFLSIDSYFHGALFLGVTLSSKTFAATIFSYKAESLINRFGLLWSFIFSQVFGCIAILVLFLGFFFHNFIVIIIGVMLTGIPMALVAILLTIVIKLIANNDVHYRKNSGTRELTTGLSMLIAAFLVPLLLMKTSLYCILLMDIGSFMVGAFLVYKMQFNKLPKYQNKDKLTIDNKVFKSKETWRFIVKVTASLLLVALVPIFASSHHVIITKQMPLILKQWIWMVDAVTLMLASFIYIFIKNLKLYYWYEFLITVNGILLLTFLIDVNNFNIFLGLMAISLLGSISFLQFRDDYVLSAGKDIRLISGYASLSLLQKSFIQFLSPLFMSLLFVKYHIQTIVIVVITIQVIGYIFGNLLIKNMK